MNIYDRQKSLNLKIPKSVCIIGTGGVGSWVALNLALTGVKKIIIIDHDTVEDTNLNRTPFKINHIGKHKATALAELIYERRSDAEVIPIPKRLEELTEVEMNMIKDVEVVVDCRDTTNPPLPQELAEKQIITCGYDGYKITIHIRPDKNYETIWGGPEPIRYTVTPSWLIPPQLIANLITTFICTDVNQKYQKEMIKTIDVREIFDLIFS